MYYTEKKMQNQDKKKHNIKGGDCGDNAEFKPSIATFTVISWKGRG